ncbi:hypothetical protein LXL04_026247 [Taraxacum kok-saghyz]
MGFEDQGEWTYVRRKKHAGGRNLESRDQLDRDHRFNGVQDDVARVAVSFLVTNLPKTLQRGELWKRCAKIGSVVDVFISPNLSKMGRRYGFVRFILIICLLLATKRNGPKRVSAEYIPRSRGQPRGDRVFVESRGKSYVAAVRGEKMNRVVHHREEKVITIQKKELTGLMEVESTVLAEVRDATSIPNLLNLCREEGFSGVKICHVGGLWVWVACDSPKICHALMLSVGIQNVFSRFKNIDSEFIVKDRMVWLEIYGLPMCAWNPCVFKRVAALWGEVLFTDDDESNSLASGKVCVRTECLNFINENVVVNIGASNFNVHVKEMALWEPEVGEEGSFFEGDNDSRKSSEEHYEEEASEEGEFVPNSFDVGHKDGFDGTEHEVQHESLVKKSQVEAKAEKTSSFPTVDDDQYPNNTPPVQFH